MTLADIPDVLDALGQLFGPGGVDSSQPSQASRLAPDRPYRSSPTKRGRRRSNADMQTIRDAIQAVVNEHAPVTVRQVFYQLVTQGVIDKTEAEYKGTICRLLVMMRRDGSIEYHDIADNTRWQRQAPLAQIPATLPQRVAAALPSRPLGQPERLRRSLAGKGSAGRSPLRRDL